MAQKVKRRGVSYYFRIELHTLQGKITSGFCFLGLFAVALMGTAVFIIKPGLEKSQYITNVLNASNHQLLLLAANTEKVVVITENKLLKNERLSREELNMYAQLLLNPLDSLKQLSPQWTSTEATLDLKMAELKTGSLLKKIKEINQSSSEQASEELSSKDLYVLQQIILDQSFKIRQQLTAEIKEGQAFINYRSDNLFSNLSLASILALITGAILGSYIVIQVLREIRMLKGKIIELSTGKLIDPIPNSRNELNSIIKAINILTDNLRNIQHFAKEVGKGNFDTDVSVFNGENDLGESLATMRDSLKEVDQEEKRRNWVSSGLAHFSELLRHSTTDMSAYYQKIISELVRYLKMNQAAIYIYRSEQGEKGILEMKASYAYGRLKYHTKTIEPGQGLAGQVFLEKEPVFLKNMPKEFMQISSGLGEAAPSHLMVVPLKVNNEVNGVLELASFQALEPHEVEFLMKIAENISGALQNVNNIHTTTHLLAEAQSMTQAMKSQEEMLRQNSEELIATQEQLNRDLQETNQQLQLLEHSIQYGPLPQLLFTAAGNVKLANKQAKQLLDDTLIGRHISSLFDQPALINLLQTTKPDTSNTLSYRHPTKGELLFHVHGFSLEHQVYVNIQIVPQTMVSLA